MGMATVMDTVTATEAKPSDALGFASDESEFPRRGQRILHPAGECFLKGADFFKRL